MSLYDLCRVIRVILCLSKSKGVIRLSLCKYESGEIYLNNESRIIGMSRGMRI